MLCSKCCWCFCMHALGRGQCYAIDLAQMTWAEYHETHQQLDATTTALRMPRLGHAPAQVVMRRRTSVDLKNKSSQKLAVNIQQTSTMRRSQCATAFMMCRHHTLIMRSASGAVYAPSMCAWTYKSMYARTSACLSSNSFCGPPSKASGLQFCDNKSPIEVRAAKNQ